MRRPSCSFLECILWPFLGAEFFRSHRILVSHSQHRTYFTEVGGPEFSFERRARAAGTEVPADGAGTPANDGK